MRRRRDARGTIEKRVYVARRWLAFIGDRWTSATWHDVDDYGDTRDVAPTTWRDEISHLHSFYTWAIRNGHCTADPTTLVERPRVGQRLPRPISPNQYARLLAEASAEITAILELMAFTGLRCCEVAGLRWVDVDLIERVATVRGKGNKERVIGLPVRVVRALAAIDSNAVHVLNGATGGAYTPARISQIVGRWARECGVAMTAHQLRHTFATTLLAQSGGEIIVVQHALGHASISSTQIYAAVDHRRAVEIARRMDGF